MLPDINSILSVTKTQEIIDFSGLILSSSPRTELPNYPSINLMEQPKLVPSIFVVDVEGSSNKILYKFSGTKIDEFYGHNMSGKCPSDYYHGPVKFDELHNVFMAAINTKVIGYVKRTVHIVNDRVDRHYISESILFPCSSDNENVDYAIGYTHYFFSMTPISKVIKLIGAGPTALSA